MHFSLLRQYYLLPAAEAAEAGEVRRHRHRARMIPGHARSGVRVRLPDNKRARVRSQTIVRPTNRQNRPKRNRARRRAPAIHGAVPIGMHAPLTENKIELASLQTIVR